MKVLCKDYGINICDASKMLSLAPAKLHKVDDVMGSIEVGKCADLVLVNEDFTVSSVILDGIVQ